MGNYIVIGTNKVEEFISLMNEFEIYSSICRHSGISESLLVKVHVEAQKRGISIYAVQESLIDEIEQRTDIGIVPELYETEDGVLNGTINDREFVFLTIDSKDEAKYGVLIPFEKDNVKITDKEISELKQILEADIDVETFLKLL